ncbi:MAG: Aspartyl/glutamyl-tRNA(Asn/Gln) amidotransferase subunit C [Candidatus Roizmanbacteria bacterium GW2011_GWA2_37_7]|uniref:Aspartyl/glutamyl-tRNA(Asn/Gln) amidotransferase subunit C n=1 Tax=Candidatus Roizmanbacteria bacterium GW2011_GWA2_37_7 TaxID=1618481 RepID=A0A0G0JL08_9BACT|nr:MAG: Aspartyl/glutamyl-tRNA(Asn/Gln) amidotransferase subunit C [Candidatus Roizmanbacteria bacterium GW2011_GWA2_37_7]
MPKQKDLTIEDVLHIAKLANLPISEDNIEMYRKQLSETISYVENLDELDTKNVVPTSHSTNLTNVYFEDGTKNERQFTQEEATQNAKNVKQGQFVVKRLM